MSTACAAGFSLLLLSTRIHVSTKACTVMDDLAELADGPTGCGEVARGGCSLSWNCSVTKTAVLTEAEIRH
jgi:hypothetical protein